MGTQTDRWPLDPIDRQSEVMFGLLMTLTFTGTMSVALGAGATVREILMAALGSNIAWGIVDATVYLLTTAAERRRGRSVPPRTPRRRRSCARFCPDRRAGR